MKYVNSMALRAIVPGLVLIWVLSAWSLDPWSTRTAASDLAARVLCDFNWYTLCGLLSTFAAVGVWPGTKVTRERPAPEILFERHWGGLGSGATGIALPSSLILRVGAGAALWLVGVWMLLMPTPVLSEVDGNATPPTSPWCEPAAGVSRVDAACPAREVLVGDPARRSLEDKNGR